MSKLPAPRLQFTWHRDKGFEKWIVDYHLVLPLQEYDIRRERDNAKDGELYIELGKTKVGGVSEEYPNDIPYRDGAHSSWDSEALGNLPVLVVSIDKTVWKRIFRDDNSFMMVPYEPEVIS